MSARLERGSAHTKCSPEILLFAAAYPDTLLPTSIRGVLTNGATLLLSPAIGTWVDRHASKFGTIKVTIVVQRISIVLACVLWICVFQLPTTKAKEHYKVEPILQMANFHFSKDLLVALIILCSVIERVCAVGNQFVMERDWVPTIASEYSKPPLHELNAIMRRIDLISKILAPVFASVIAIRTSSAMLAAITAAMNVATVGIELITARTAWKHCSVLERGRDSKPETPSIAEDQEGRETAPVVERKSSLALYFSNDAWLGMSSRFPCRDKLTTLSIYIGRSTILLRFVTLGPDDNLPPNSTLFVIPDHFCPDTHICS